MHKDREAWAYPVAAEAHQNSQPSDDHILNTRHWQYFKAMLHDQSSAARLQLAQRVAQVAA